MHDQASTRVAGLHLRDVQASQLCLELSAPPQPRIGAFPAMQHSYKWRVQSVVTNEASVRRPLHPQRFVDNALPAPT
jgi:hypothetical protein